MNFVPGLESLFALCTVTQNGWEMIELDTVFLVKNVKFTFSLHVQEYVYMNSLHVQEYVAFHLFS